MKIIVESFQWPIFFVIILCYIIIDTILFLYSYLLVSISISGSFSTVAEDFSTFPTLSRGCRGFVPLPAKNLLQPRDRYSVSYNQTGIYFSELPQWLRNRRYKSGWSHIKSHKASLIVYTCPIIHTFRIYLYMSDCQSSNSHLLIHLSIHLVIQTRNHPFVYKSIVCGVFSYKCAYVGLTR